MGANKQMNYNEISNQIESLIQTHSLDFTDISLISVKAIFTLECEILQHLFKALIELQRLQFLPSLALIHGAHARLTAWEGAIQSKEVKTFLGSNIFLLLKCISDVEVGYFQK